MSNIKQIKFINQPKTLNIINEDIYNVNKIKRKLRKTKNTNKINLYKLIKIFIKVNNNKNIHINFENFFVSFKIKTKNFSEKYFDIIISLNNYNNKKNFINFSVYPYTRIATLTGITKNNDNFDVKKAVSIGIDICKKLKIKKINVQDDSFFKCKGYNIYPLSNFYLLQKQKTWYSYHFGFVPNNKFIYNLNNNINKLSKITLKKTLEKVPKFINFLQTFNKNIDLNVKLINLFNNIKLNKKQCKILNKYDLINKIFKIFKINTYTQKNYVLELSKWNYKYL